MDKPRCGGTAPTQVELQAGKKYAWCTCGISAKQPFCDGGHNQEGCDFKPMVFTAEKDETVWLCNCKLTGDAPRCDGAHSRIETAGGEGAE